MYKTIYSHLSKGKYQISYTLDNEFHKVYFKEAGEVLN